MDLVVSCYSATRKFPDREAFGLMSQMQRAAISTPANMAEGQGRQHRSEFIQFLCIANGSLTELETHVQIARRLNYIGDEEERQLLAQTGEVGRLLNGLLCYLRRKGSPTAPGQTGNRQPRTDNSCV